MKRNTIQALINWKSNDERKPMVLKGARQVGKTWLMKEFGKMNMMLIIIWEQMQIKKLLIIMRLYIVMKKLILKFLI